MAQSLSFTGLLVSVSLLHFDLRFPILLISRVVPLIFFKSKMVQYCDWSAVCNHAVLTIKFKENPTYVLVCTCFVCPSTHREKKTNSDLVYASAFPRVALVVCFPALSTGCWFPALYWLQVVCFPALGGSCTFLIGLL